MDGNTQIWVFGKSGRPGCRLQPQNLIPAHGSRLLHSLRPAVERDPLKRVFANNAPETGGENLALGQIPDLSVPVSLALYEIGQADPEPKRGPVLFRNQPDRCEASSMKRFPAFAY